MLKTVAITSGGGGGNGTVTQVGGTGTVNGITLTGNVTTTGNLTLGGTLANVTNSQLSNSAVTIGNTTVSLGGSTSSLGNLALNNVTVGATTANTGVFTTLTNTGTAYLGGLSGNQSLQVNNVASAVNYAQIEGAVTTGSPVISAQGTDANIALKILAKGTANVNLGGSSTTPSLIVSPVTSQVNSFSVYGNSTGNSPTLSAVGADANVGIAMQAKGTGGVQLQSNNATVISASNVSGTDFTNLYSTTGNLNYTAAGGSTNINFYYQTKGTGGYNFTTGGGQQVGITNTASAVNYLNLTGAATTAAPTISAQGSDANISFTIATKGTGIVQTAATLKYAGVISGLTTKTAAYTIVATDHTVLGNATTASFSLTLPTSVGATGQVYIVKKVDSTANTVTITTTSSQTIDGSASKVLSYQYDGFQLQSDGANWMIIGNIFGRNGTTGTF